MIQKIIFSKRKDNMFSKKAAYLMIVFILIFSGCTLTNSNKSIDIKETEIQKPIEIKAKKIETKKPLIKKKISTYKHCNKHIKIMNHASKYIQEEFSKGYFIQRDVVGAKAQLFLIESNSESIFAKNINNAIKSYDNQYNQAKKNRCNLSRYRISPLKKVKLKLQKLEKYMLKKEDKK